MDAFTDLCLNRFPSEPAFAKGVSERQLAPMQADHVKQFLHDDRAEASSGQALPAAMR